MQAAEYDVAVVGAGIVGASATYWLARQGARVVVVEGHRAGRATAAGAGILSPATKFAAPAAFLDLAFPALTFYDELVRELGDAGETATGYAVVGALHIARTPAEADLLRGYLRLVTERRARGLPGVGVAALLDGAAARRRFPPLADVPGALWVSGAARVDGRLLTDALLRAAARAGAAIRSGAARLTREVAGRDGATRMSVVVDGQRVAAERVLLAAGIWSRELARPIGLELPIMPQRGQIAHLQLVAEPAAAMPPTGDWPIVEGEHSHYLLGFPGGRVVAGATRETDVGHAETDVRVTAGGLREVLTEALALAPGLADATLLETRVGLRPLSPDGLPLLGAIPDAPGLFVATGHGPSGLLLGPISGKLVAELLWRGAAAQPLDAYSPARFAAP